MTDDIPRQRLIDLRAKIVADRDVHRANVAATDGALQAVDLLLAPVPESVVKDPES